MGGERYLEGVCCSKEKKVGACDFCISQKNFDSSPKEKSTPSSPPLPIFSPLFSSSDYRKKDHRKKI